MKRRAIAILVLLLIAAFITGCGQPAAGDQPLDEPTAGSGPTAVSHGGPVEDYGSLIDALRAAGATVEPAGEVEQPFFSVKGQIIQVNGVDVQVFEYEDEAAAQREAAKVGPDGSTFETIIVDWVSPPHFYQKDRIIVLYVGDGAAIRQMLENALGAQFAGGE